MADATSIAALFSDESRFGPRLGWPPSRIRICRTPGVFRRARRALSGSRIKRAGVATLYTVNGLTATPAGGRPLLWSPGPDGPTGQVNNSIGGVATTSFVTNQSGTPAAAHFIFASLNGNIYAWAAAPNPARWQRRVRRGPPTPVWPLPVPPRRRFSTLPTTLRVRRRLQRLLRELVARFRDIATCSAGLVPFNVQNIGGTIYVTYAPAGAFSRRPRPRSGAVAILNPNGTFTTFSTSSQLAAPWGVALAPAGFGPFSGDLLIGNFAYGNLSAVGGEINAYNPTDRSFPRHARQQHGLAGALGLNLREWRQRRQPRYPLFYHRSQWRDGWPVRRSLAVPEPSTLALLGAGVLSLYAWRRRSSRPRDEVAG